MRETPGTETADEAFSEPLVTTKGGGGMRREIVFRGTGKLAEALQIDPARIGEIETQVHRMISAGHSVKSIITTMNDRGDLSDAEWTAFVFSLGHFCGRTGQ